jgi:hypothetical protein
MGSEMGREKGREMEEKERERGDHGQERGEEMMRQEDLEKTKTKPWRLLKLFHRR